MNLNQVTLNVTDLDRAITFYRRLGLTLIVHTHDAYARFECPGGATVSLHLAKTPTVNGPRIYFECEDLDDRVAALKADGVVFESGPEDKRYLWREARLSDPDGNALCFYWAGENRRFPPWRHDGQTGNSL